MVTKAKDLQQFAQHFHPLVSIEFYIISMDTLDSLTPLQKDVLEQFQVIYSISLTPTSMQYCQF
jgi:hypothetical protein